LELRLELEQSDVARAGGKLFLSPLPLLLPSSSSGREQKSRPGEAQGLGLLRGMARRVLVGPLGVHFFGARGGRRRGERERAKSEKAMKKNRRKK
jgi:hypothetical protein